MVVPRLRLIFWTALITLPCAVLAGAGGPGLVAGASIICAFLLFALLDAGLAPARLRGVQVELPALVRLQQRRPGPADVIIHAPLYVRLVRLGIGFPQEMNAADFDRWIALPVRGETPAGGEGAPAKIEITCQADRRGSYRLAEIQLEVLSPAGLWSARKTQAAASEFRVYPNLADERSRVAALFLRRANAGTHVQRVAGQGREFEKLRDYAAGDILSDIHWKATAKRNKPVTKVYQIERSHEVYVVVDASRLSARPAGGKSGPGAPSCLERYVTAALLLGVAAEQQGDQFGLITFSDRIINFVRARTGKAHFDACRDQLYGIHAESVSPNFEELCTFIRLRLRKRALIIFLTHLDDPVLARGFSRGVELISRQHLLLADMLVRDQVRPLFSPDAAPVETDDLYHELAGHLQWQSLRELQSTLRRRGVRLSFVKSETIAAEVIAQHADVRARQLI